MYDPFTRRSSGVGGKPWEVPGTQREQQREEQRQGRNSGTAGSGSGSGEQTARGAAGSELETTGTSWTAGTERKEIFPYGSKSVDGLIIS
eukprot:gene9374-biopygen22713